MCHFYELVSLLLDEPVEFDRKDSAYYEALVEMAREAVAQGQQCLEKYDAVLVDEGQDFDNKMIRTLVGLLNPGGRLLIAMDEYQDLYRGGRSWKALGIQAQGRTRHLRQVYRNTGEILAFSQRFIGEDPRRTHPSPSLLPEESVPHGDPPQMPAYGEEGEVERFLERDIRELTERGEFKRSEIAVLYDDKVYEPGKFRYAGKEYPVRLRRVLEGAGIPVKWVSEDVRAKEQFDVTTDRVTLVSIHSAKGLDFELVYLAGADRIQPTEATRDQLVRLLYVAMTRARYRLVIPYLQETEFIRRMKTCAAGKCMI